MYVVPDLATRCPGTTLHHGSKHCAVSATDGNPQLPQSKSFHAKKKSVCNTIKIAFFK